MAAALERLIAAISPAWGASRARQRGVMALYEAAQPSRLRKFHRDTASSPNQQVRQGAIGVRMQARHLEQNLDIARGALRTVVNNVVGPQGIGIEPTPRRADGTVHEDYAKALRDAWRDWCKVPEVTQEHHFARVQRLICRTWLRDGECFGQHLSGPIQFLDHGTAVPYSIELFEPDMVPFDFDDPSQGVRQGIQLNAWGRRTGLFVYRGFPGDSAYIPRASDLKRIAWGDVIHIAALDRIGQLRGVSEFASIITRLEDVRDMEESERIAAKLAARLTAYIKKGSPDLFDPEHDTADRDISFNPGTVIDGLRAGEEVGIIDSKRPNTQVVAFRMGQLRACAAGFPISYSSLARDYDGTYSAQRQELVEQWIHYATLTDDFVGQALQPIWSRFVATAHASGVVRRPADVVAGLGDDALFLAQAMPWIDPEREASAFNLMVRNGFMSEVEVIRRRGGNPEDTREAIRLWRIKTAADGIVSDANPADDADRTAPAPAAPPANASGSRARAARTR